MKAKLKILIWLIFSVMIVFTLNFVFKTNKTILGTVLRVEYMDATPLPPFPESSKITRGQKILLEISPGGGTTEIFIIYEKRLFIGQIIEVQAEGKGHRLSRIIK
ncbi:MAG: hypothetical protein KKA41_10075 [Proteobacteria bacterium]|nr:hypothetical protein [Pseudomonadota bacterium]